MNLSLIIPVYNEEENLPLLYASIDQALSPLKDTWEVIRAIMDGRKRREIDPTLAALRECAAQLEKDKETPAAVRERIEEQLEFLETITRWFEAMKRIPRRTLLKMMRMGERIAKVIGE